MVTVHNFSDGMLNPALAYLVSCLGGFLGLRCVAQSRTYDGGRRASWLCLAAVAIGTTGIWAMHFIAMLGFSIPGQTINYNVPITIASMLLAIVVVGVGLFIVGYGDGGWRRLLLGGAIIGVGVAAMHYIGMAAMVMQDTMSYRPLLVAASVVIAIIAGTAALWIGTWVRGWLATLGASLVFGLAVCGMHYTGTAAMQVHAATSGTMAMGGSNGTVFLLPMIVGITVITLIITLIISLSGSAEEVALDQSIQRNLAELERRRREQEQQMARSTQRWDDGSPGTRFR
jgi:NO-binding membrane sensor protein with MHYT domain